MHESYRCYIKTKDVKSLQKALKKIEMEASTGEVFNLYEISQIEMSQSLEPIGQIFEEADLYESQCVCTVFDHHRPYEHFVALTEYFFENLHENAGNDFVLIADISNYDYDESGDHILYYLTDGDSLKKMVIEGNKGFKLHCDVHISEIMCNMPKSELTKVEKQAIKDYYKKLERPWWQL